MRGTKAAILGLWEDKLHKIFGIAALAIGLAAEPATLAIASDDAAKTAVVGKTISSGKAVLKARKNGRLTGKVGPMGM